jgi:hypothetical protein
MRIDTYTLSSVADPDTDPHQLEKKDPDSHQSNVNPQHFMPKKYYGSLGMDTVLF